MQMTTQRANDVIHATEWIRRYHTGYHATDRSTVEMLPNKRIEIPLHHP
jgi:hypothetical protein